MHGTHFLNIHDIILVDDDIIIIKKQSDMNGEKMKK